ncbi:MAG: hypothetical protein ACOZCF_10935 [Bacillota bacterium]
MVFRLAVESDLEMLSEMRWQHEREEGGQSDITKGEFMEQCKAFLKEGMERGISRIGSQGEPFGPI